MDPIADLFPEPRFLRALHCRDLRDFGGARRDLERLLELLPADRSQARMNELLTEIALQESGR